MQTVPINNSGSPHQTAKRAALLPAASPSMASSTSPSITPVAPSTAPSIAPSIAMLYSADQSILLSEFSAFERQTNLRAQHVTMNAAYQPVFDIASNQICGAECLLRVQHDLTGPIDTATFINAIEKTDFIHDLGRWMAQQCIAAALAWQSRGLPHITFSINASPREIVREGFPDELIAQVTQAGIALSNIKIELTETSLIMDFASCQRALCKLRDAGIQIALDDFGAGYASLSYLRQLPINVIKIDRSFTEHLHESRVDQVVMQHLITLAHDLDTKVVAEGIETAQQLAALAAYGCDQGQGYYLGRPMPFAELIRRAC